MNYILKLSILLFVFLPTFSSAEISSKSTPDEAISILKNRGSVLSNLETDYSTQFIVPPQYSLCLFAASVQARLNNNEAHSFLLNQIDFLTGSGVSIDKIKGLISYGHGITNATYSMKSNKSLDQLTIDDFSSIQEFSKNLFLKNRCVKVFEDSNNKAGILKLLK